MKVRARRPAPINNTTASAISAVTRMLRMRCCGWLGVDRDVLCFRASSRFTFDDNIAGESPNRMPVNVATINVKSSTVWSRWTLSKCGI
jgi:hypothetical protein